MKPLLDRSLVFVTGKGGVGKTTIAGAVGLLAASQGRRTLVLDTSGASRRLRELFGAGRAPEPGEPVALAELAEGELRPFRVFNFG